MGILELLLVIFQCGRSSTRTEAFPASDNPTS
jgi:hypothetical protein